MIRNLRNHKLGFLLSLALLLSVGCGEKPTVSTVGTAATAGGVEFSVGDYTVKYLEVSDGEDTYEYPRPVLAIPITVKNLGPDKNIYSPTHSTQQMTEATTPLLYVDPGAEADLPPDKKVPVNGVYLEKGSAQGQVTVTTTMEKDDVINDVFFFEVPDSSQDLVLSLPPAMHRGKMPVLFRFNFQPMEAKGPKYSKIGNATTFNGVKFTLDSSDIEYVQIDDTVQGKGFSADPLLKISYTVENGSKEAITFSPGHKTSGQRGAALYAGDDTMKRIKFAATSRVVDQLDKSKTLKPGESVKDFVLFERPPEDAKTLRLEYPASTFEQQGLARYSIDYEYKNPDKPKELKQ